MNPRSAAPHTLTSSRRRALTGLLSLAALTSACAAFRADDAPACSGRRPGRQDGAVRVGGAAPVTGGAPTGGQCAGAPR